MASSRTLHRRLQEYWGDVWPRGKVAATYEFEQTEATLHLTMIHRFDEEGALAERIGFDAQGQREWTWRYDFNQPTVFRCVLTNSLGQVETTWCYTWHEPTSTLFEVSLKDQARTREDSFQCDDEGRIVGHTLYETPQRVLYDRSDRVWLVESKDEGGSWSRSCENAYGPHGDIVRVRLPGTCRELRRDLTYDAWGNWTQKTEVWCDSRRRSRTTTSHAIRQIQYRESSSAEKCGHPLGSLPPPGA